MTTFTDEKFDYYNQVREDLGLDAVWSIFEVENLSERHPYKGVTKVIYRAYGSGDHEVTIEGDTWKSLYVAADQLIRESGDGHHIFIEDFKQSSINSEILFVTTGS